MPSKRRPRPPKPKPPIVVEPPIEPIEPPIEPPIVPVVGYLLLENMAALLFEDGSGHLLLN